MRIFEDGRRDLSGTEFFIRGWAPEHRDPKAVIALVHGLGEHTGRYAHVGRALTEAGYILAGFDLRGHGKSSGQRGHFPSLEAVMQDIQGFLAYLAQRYAGKPRFLYGHSLGGLLVLTFALKHPAGLKGVIASSPGLSSAIHEQRVKAIMARVLGPLAPSVPLASDLEVSALSRDPQVAKAYVQDPLVHDRLSLGFGVAGLGATDFVFEHASDIRVPLLLMHGKMDRLAYPRGSEEFASAVRAAGEDVTLKLWDGLYHELHNEPEQQEVLRFVIHWLDAHI